ncbi:MAG: hypothetical protein HXX11_12210 [Desulfuromonadales bacterium]|nr:hypothetical protein [Desulfuromonadales bacterium]
MCSSTVCCNIFIDWLHSKTGGAESSGSCTGAGSAWPPWSCRSARTSRGIWPNRNIRSAWSACSCACACPCAR